MEMELKTRPAVASVIQDDDNERDTLSGSSGDELHGECKLNGVFDSKSTKPDHVPARDFSTADDKNCAPELQLAFEESHLVQEINSDKNDTASDDNDDDYSDEELLFEEVKLTPAMQEKVQRIEDALNEDCSVETLKQFALSEYGLVTDQIRRKVWPKLVGITTEWDTNIPTCEELKNHREYNQVICDVHRSLKRFPPGIPYEKRIAMQGQLTRLILRVIIKHPELYYYQGYHDVAVTFLLIMGESVAFQIMEKLSMGPFKHCMGPNFQETSHLLNYIYPLIKRLHPSLHDYLERSEVDTLFALPWFLAWFAHNLNKYEDVVRLYDFFLVSPPLMPLYLAAVIVVHRQEELFAADCDMGQLHHTLLKIPDDLPFETLLVQARDLYEQFPPESIKREADDRAQKRSMIQRQSDAVPYTNLPPYHHLMFWKWVPWNRVVPQLIALGQVAPRRRYASYFVLPVFTTVVAFYAYCKMADAYEIDLINYLR